MFLIDQVEVLGFWGNSRIHTKFYNDINIFIGKNGTGKTTFINLLYAVLKGEIKNLLNYEFDSIEVILKDSRSRTLKIVVTKSETSESPFQEIKYVIDGIDFPFLVSENEIESLLKSKFRRTQFSDSISQLENELEKLINISNLTVHRYAFDFHDNDFRYNRRIENQFIPPIDKRLSDLLADLKVYHLSLSQQVEMISLKLQKEVLTSMLYNPSFDKFSVETETEKEIRKEKEALIKAFKDLKAYDESIEKKIEKHIAALTKSNMAIQEFITKPKNEKKDIAVNDVLPYPLIKRTKHIIELSLNADVEKQKVFSLVTLYIQLISSFIKDKQVNVTSSGELSIIKNGKPIDPSSLSSGEKQIIILLTETLLQKNEPFIFLADEPELSLHIEWQSQVISSIMKLNRNAQVIVATHSPEIAAGRKDKLIDMWEIVHAEY